MSHVYFKLLLGKSIDPLHPLQICLVNDRLPWSLYYESVSNTLQNIYHHVISTDNYRQFIYANLYNTHYACNVLNNKEGDLFVVYKNRFPLSLQIEVLPNVRWINYEHLSTLHSIPSQDIQIIKRSFNF